MREVQGRRKPVSCPPRSVECCVVGRNNLILSRMVFGDGGASGVFGRLDDSDLDVRSWKFPGDWLWALYGQISRRIGTP